MSSIWLNFMGNGYFIKGGKIETLELGRNLWIRLWACGEGLRGRQYSPLFTDVLFSPKTTYHCDFSMEFHYTLCGNYIINSFISGEVEIKEESIFSRFTQWARIKIRFKTLKFKRRLTAMWRHWRLKCRKSMLAELPFLSTWD